MFESLIGLVAIIGLIIVVARQQRRLRLIERELGALRSFVLSSAPAAAPATVAPETEELAREATVEAADAALAHKASAAPAAPEPTEAEPAANATEAAGQGPWTRGDEAAVAGSAAPERKPDIETALGTRWAVWVGGLALALGGIFLVRYSIEAGIFGPGVRLVMAGLLGLLLVSGGEFIRRTGFRVPVEGVQSAYVPGILTAAGAFTLFGTIYAAHGIYGFIGPAPAFVLMAAIGLAAIAASLVHGQALAGLGLLGSFVTPVLVASNAPSPWSLFGFLAIILAATGVIARIRDWPLLMGAAFAGTGVWCLIYLVSAGPADLKAVAFIGAVTLAVQTFIWLRGDADATAAAGISAGVDKPSIVPALLVGLAAISLGIDPLHAAAGGTWLSAAFLIALVAVAFYRYGAIATLYAAGVATILIYVWSAFGGDFDIEFWNGGIQVDGMPVSAASANFVPLGLAIGVVFLAAGLWMARRFAGTSRYRAASWGGWASLVPVVVLAATWLAFGNIDRDLSYALAGFVITLLLVAGSEWVARAEEPPLKGDLAVSLVVLGSGVALVLTLLMALGAGMTTVLIGLAAVLPAFATRYRTYAILGWMSVGAAAVTLVRVAFDPTIVGWEFLQTTPVFNWLLPGYGVPALAFGFAAWQLARTTNGRPRLAMEAVTALFGLLTVAMLVRHAMNGGVIDAGAPSLAEQAIYTLIAIGGSAILVALDTRSPSPVFRHGSIGIGVASVVFIAIQHFAALLPLLSNESTGTIVFFNLLLLAYLLPGAAMAVLALYVRGKRPQWYVAMLAVAASVLAFAYATLSVRRLFHGEFIGLWKGMSQLETYSYSALWLAMGVVLLVLGMRLNSRVVRIASAALVVVAVAKVFLFDMSELEGVLRALSFIGLGAVLIGIGLFYQRMLTATAAK
jgi:uncharacterized membrane protein